MEIFYAISHNSGLISILLHIEIFEICLIAGALTPRGFGSITHGNYSYSIDNELASRKAH